MCIFCKSVHDFWKNFLDWNYSMLCVRSFFFFFVMLKMILVMDLTVVKFCLNLCGNFNCSDTPILNRESWKLFSFCFVNWRNWVALQREEVDDDTCTPAQVWLWIVSALRKDKNCFTGPNYLGWSINNLKTYFSLWALLTICTPKFLLKPFTFQNTFWQKILLTIEIPKTTKNNFK